LDETLKILEEKKEYFKNLPSDEKVATKNVEKTKVKKERQAN
jgi:hypothetical protein